MHALHCGTSSWSEKTWVGSFYPPGTKPADMLTYYATQFTTVEADNTYYRVPTRAMVRGWREKTPTGFTMCAKFPRSIVHCGEGAAPDATKVLVPEHVDAELERFVDVMGELGDRAGPLVLQFPYFNESAFRDQAEFLARLDPFLARLPTTFRYGVEVRNKAWVNQALLDVLRAHRAAFVLLDLVYIPHPASMKLDLVTTDFSYVRLIGDRKAVEAATDTFDHIVLDKSDMLERWAQYLLALLPRVRIYGYANNHYAGHGPDTIRDLARRIEAGRD